MTPSVKLVAGTGRNLEGVRATSLHQRLLLSTPEKEDMQHVASIIKNDKHAPPSLDVTAL